MESAFPLFNTYLPILKNTALDVYPIHKILMQLFLILLKKYHSHTNFEAGIMGKIGINNI